MPWDKASSMQDIAVPWDERSRVQEWLCRGMRLRCGITPAMQGMWMEDAGCSTWYEVEPSLRKRRGKGLCRAGVGSGCEFPFLWEVGCHRPSIWACYDGRRMPNIFLPYPLPSVKSSPDQTHIHRFGCTMLSESRPSLPARHAGLRPGRNQCLTHREHWAPSIPLGSVHPTASLHPSRSPLDPTPNHPSQRGAPGRCSLGRPPTFPRDESTLKCQTNFLNYLSGHFLPGALEDRGGTLHSSSAGTVSSCGKERGAARAPAGSTLCAPVLSVSQHSPWPWPQPGTSPRNAAENKEVTGA